MYARSANPAAAAANHDRAPSLTDLRVVTALAVAYGLVVTCTLPWSSQPGPQVPRVILAANGTIFFADLLTALLLGREWLRDPRPSYAWISAAYLYSGLMATLHLACFPGALFHERLFGSVQTTSWIFLLWRLGTAILLGAAVFSAARPASPIPAADRHVRLAQVLGGATAAAALVALAGTHLDLPVQSGTRFTPFNLSMIVAYEVICAAALLRILRSRGFGDSLYLWLAIVLVAYMSEQLLGSLSGGQYTIGWHLGKASSAVSACVLLAFWLGSMRLTEGERLGARVAAYAAALGAMLAALLLRWFLIPWIGLDFPYATLFGAVAVAVWVGGLGPGAVAALLGFLVSSVYFIEPVGVFHLATPREIFGALMYWVSSALIIVLGEAMRRARDRYRRSEALLRERAAELQRADTNKSQFLAVLSHELRNPLAPLSNGLAVLQMSSDAETAARTRAMMERQLRQLKRLIDDLLDVSRIDRGKLELARERVALDAIAHNAIDTAKPAIEAKHQALVVRHSTEPLFVDADVVRLSQVVANLLNNASKFTPAGGTIEVAMAAEHGEAVLRVTDSGMGFAGEEAQRIFEPFVQLDRGIAHSGGGLGLGLALVRSLVELHGGRVSASSPGSGLGATFEIRLPMADAVIVQLPHAARTPPHRA